MQALQRGFEAVLEQLAIWGPRILFGLLLLLVGWLVARLVQTVAARLAARLGLDRPFTGSPPGADMPALPATSLPSRVLGIAMFWVVMLFAIVTFLTTLQLESVALPIQTVLVRIGEWLPNLLAAALLTIVGWVLGSFAHNVVVRLLKGVKIDEHLGKLGVLSEAAVRRFQFSSIVGVIAYVLVLLLFVVPAMDVLGITVIASVAQSTMQMIAGAIPGILAAAVVMGVAALIAFVVRPPVTRLVAATGVDSWGKHIGLDPARGPGAAISSVVGHIVFWLILLLAFPAALDRLGLEPISTPLRETWTAILTALPRAAAALGIGLGAVLLVRILRPLVERLLQGAGFDGILGRIGLARVQAASQSGAEPWLPSKIVGMVVALVIYLLLGQEALRVLGLAYMAELVNQIVRYLPNIFVAVVILGIALYVANVVAQLVRQAASALSGFNAELAAGAAYVSIVVFGAAMAVGQLDVGGDLVQRTVLLIIAAFCLAAAIALGLGLRPLIERWAQSRFSHWVDQGPGRGTR